MGVLLYLPAMIGRAIISQFNKIALFTRHAAKLIIMPGLGIHNLVKVLCCFILVPVYKAFRWNAGTHGTAGNALALIINTLAILKIIARNTFMPDNKQVSISEFYTKILNLPF